MTPSGPGQPQSGQTVFSAGPTVRGFYYDNGSGSGQGTFAAPSAPGSGSNGNIMSPAASGTSMGVGIRREVTPPPGNSRPLKKGMLTTPYAIKLK